MGSAIELSKVKLPDEWKQLLKEELLSEYFAQIKTHYINALACGEEIYPKSSEIFNAFYLTSLQSLRVVILGQDPYHGSAVINGIQTPQAMGLSFSVPYGMPIPPSLKNIHKELYRSLSIVPPNHGDLSGWARQGVLLLNCILSVRAGAAASHKHFGWESFSDGVIRRISESKSGVVFMLWGNYAKKKAALIDTKKHKIITAPHPSPLAQGFVGSDVFKQANAYLIATGQKPIEWERFCDV